MPIRDVADLLYKEARLHHESSWHSGAAAEAGVIGRKVGYDKSRPPENLDVKRRRIEVATWKEGSNSEYE